MVFGTLTADDPWGIVPAFAMTMVFWPIISLIFILYYNLKGNERGEREGAPGAPARVARVGAPVLSPLSLSSLPFLLSLQIVLIYLISL